MSQISAEEVKNLFALARLPLDEGSLPARQKDLEEILAYVASLSRLNVSSAKEIHGGTNYMNAFREDAVVSAFAAVRDAIANSFPTSEADLNKVLSILGK